MDPVEIIAHNGKALVYLVRGDWFPDRTEFLTPDEASLQIGMIVYGGGKAIQPHVHLPVTREVHGTSECILVRRGACEIDIYTELKEHIATRPLRTGDIVLLLGGGHGFRMQEDTVLFEVKQGPFVGMKDKERFDA